jgi:hypothetical protein
MRGQQYHLSVLAKPLVCLSQARPLQGAVVCICDREISRGRRRATGLPQTGPGGIRYIDRSMVCIEKLDGSDGVATPALPLLSRAEARRDMIIDRTSRISLVDPWFTGGRS